MLRRVSFLIFKMRMAARKDGKRVDYLHALSISKVTKLSTLSHCEPRIQRLIVRGAAKVVKQSPDSIGD